MAEGLCSGPQPGEVLTGGTLRTIALLSASVVSLRAGAMPRGRGSRAVPRPLSRGVALGRVMGDGGEGESCSGDESGGASRDRT